MATADDPFTVVMAQTWAMLEANAGFTDLVLVGNRIKFDEDDPVKERVSSADKPEVRLIPLTLGPGDNIAQMNVAASNTSLIKFDMELQISTGQVRLVPPAKVGRENVFRVLWEAIRATYAADTYFKSVTLTWGEDETVFKVHRFRTLSASIGVLESDLTRGIEGWSALLAFEVTMNFGIAQHQPS